MSEELPDAVATAAAMAEGDTEATDPVVEETEEETAMTDAEAIEAEEAEEEGREELVVVAAAAAGAIEVLGPALLGDACWDEEEVLVAAPRLLASRLQKGRGQ